MPREVVFPPDVPANADGTKAAGWWHESGEGKLTCDLCPRACTLGPDGRGFCFVRQNLAGRMVSTTYGRSTGFSIDPIEKKPLNHFYPGTAVLSFGTAGCNLGCKFCQNWTSSKSREVDSYCELAQPEAVARASRELACRSVAFTYNDPIVWAEYAIDTARACREQGIKTVAVTSGYINPTARTSFYEHIDAANIDLKAFSEEFYRELTAGHLDPVLDTLEWLVHQTDVWVEITNLIIPGANDSPEELERLCSWIVERLRPDVPVHFSAFHPDFRMLDRPPTPLETLLKAHDIARRTGLRYVYTGNVSDQRHQTTYCPSCGGVLIERDGYRLGAYALKDDCCGHCGAKIAGRFDRSPGDWGSRRQPVRIADFAPAEPVGDSQMQDRPTNQPTADPPGTGRPELTEQEEALVFRAAGERVGAAVSSQSSEAIGQLPAEVAQKPLLGAFVSLKRGGQLRSCCGFLGQSVPLAKALGHAADRAATDDPRFPPISPTELSHLDMEVWLLWGLRPLTQQGEDRVDAIQIGRHGLQISRGGARGLLLPSVAVEHNLDAENFLRQVCLKAQLPPDAWKDDSTTLMTFEGHAIHGKLGHATAGPQQDTPGGGPTPAELNDLVDFCGHNITALLQGATPNFYLPGGYDGSASGLTLRVRLPEGEDHLEISRLVVRPLLPLQSTLFNLVQAASAAMQSRPVTTGPVTTGPITSAQVGLSVLWDTALHGTVDKPDLAGINPRRRAVAVLHKSGWAWVYDPQLTPEELLAEAAKRVGVSEARNASVVSLAIVSTDPKAAASNVQRPQAARPPAVAGRFYPGDPAELNRLLDEMLPAERHPEPWPAVMVPHAGWVYSGSLAAEVFGRVEIPPQVIIIGPKHTAAGADWAVAPNDRWSLPGGEVLSDPELARQLADAVSGLELDATAHRTEHAIEVQLPILARLAPESRVVGVAMHGGDWPRLERLAEQLADVIRHLPQRPLLVISSDMNHYADDAETRRLDRLVLDAIETLDPKGVYETVMNNRISMCGVVPAVVVMETLRRLGSLERCEPVGYATSADASGDKSHVVGYAGMLFG